MTNQILVTHFLYTVKILTRFLNFSFCFNRTLNISIVSGLRKRKQILTYLLLTTFFPMYLFIISIHFTEITLQRWRRLTSVNADHRKRIL